jgi:hypothetical protein
MEGNDVRSVAPVRRREKVTLEPRSPGGLHRCLLNVGFADCVSAWLAKGYVCSAATPILAGAG